MSHCGTLGEVKAAMLEVVLLLLTDVVETEDPLDGPEELREDVIEELREDVIEELREDVIEELKEDVIEKLKEDVIEELKEDVIEELSEEAIEKLLEELVIELLSGADVTEVEDQLPYDIDELVVQLEVEELRDPEHEPWTVTYVFCQWNL